MTGYEPGRLIHIYRRYIYDLCRSIANSDKKVIPFYIPKINYFDECTDINDIKEEYFKIENYNCHYERLVPYDSLELVNINLK